jgi:Cu-Zn family superoxide dismutase
MSQKIVLYNAVMDYIASRQQAVAQSFTDEMAPTGIPLELLVYRKFSENYVYIRAYTSLDILASHLEHHALTSPTFVKLYLENMRLYRDAHVTVFGEMMSLREEKISWQVCLEDMNNFAIQIVERFRIQARCDVTVSSGDPAYPIQGAVNFSQPLADSRTTVNIDLSGFQSANLGRKHGIHIHEGGTIDERCMKAGSHFNPLAKQHGAPKDDNRHVGDLGNIEVNKDGRVLQTMVDEQIALFGPNNIIGRTLVIHALEDDHGQGGFEDSKTTGHAGGRIGCCVIYQTYD